MTTIAITDKLAQQNDSTLSMILLFNLVSTLQLFC